MCCLVKVSLYRYLEGRQDASRKRANKYVCYICNIAICHNNYLIHPFSFELFEDEAKHLLVSVNWTITSSGSFRLALMLSLRSSSCFSSASCSLISTIPIILTKLWNLCFGKAFISPLAIISFIAFH